MENKFNPKDFSVEILNAIDGSAVNLNFGQLVLFVDRIKKRINETYEPDSENRGNINFKEQENGVRMLVWRNPKWMTSQEK